ncbi:hypothetical protein LINGRAHAP2_LOCUS15107 [Linum grandiflorum]
MTRPMMASACVVGEILESFRIEHSDPEEAKVAARNWMDEVFATNKTGSENDELSDDDSVEEEFTRINSITTDFCTHYIEEEERKNSLMQLLARGIMRLCCYTKEE